MIRTAVPDYIDPEFAVPLAIVLWILFILIVLVQNQRAKIRRRKAARHAYLSGRREAYIEAANAQDEAYNQELAQKAPQKRDRR